MPRPRLVQRPTSTTSSESLNFPELQAYQQDRKGSAVCKRRATGPRHFKPPHYLSALFPFWMSLGRKESPRISLQLAKPPRSPQPPGAPYCDPSRRPRAPLGIRKLEELQIDRRFGAFVCGRRGDPECRHNKCVALLAWQACSPRTCQAHQRILNKLKLQQTIVCPIEAVS
jgi:hypothetical protein